MALGLCLSSAAWAGKAKPEVEVSGLLFAHYGYLLSEEADGYNEFDIDRVYLTAKGRLNPRLSVRVTTDVGRAEPQEMDTNSDGEPDTEIPADEKIQVVLKYAYLEWRLSDKIKMRFGSASTGFIGLYDRFWGQRYIAKALTDETKILDSADIGVHAMGRHRDGLISWHAGVLNGEGYGSMETNSAKAMQARLTVDPIVAGGNASLPISAFISQDVMAPDEVDSVRVLAGSVGFAMDFATLWGEYVMQSEGEVNGSGFSVTVMPKIPDVLNIVSRYERWDPDDEVEQDAADTIKVGLARDFFTKVSGALLYERTSFEAEPDTPEHGVFVRMQAGF